ncbi:CCA tRNA nucleotidyltransferase [Sneathiella sp. P13V-1]|uniref:CCA tRNA nucleotidyltransferase n=1 Tax=Sneathiella sp. P13V-1 TaxID=2697366 RepID=UPI00187B269A|nr:CCA tRNA nucleotidyltransferase [Sneathiella sp. P13V-1]MBE7635529.1 CCA tRNA nucleotidyltransferase [Sneathiella sp. P13V-1]
MSDTFKSQNLSLGQPEWLDYPESKKLFSAISLAGGSGRFVGGCVRDAFFDKVSDDLDICTDLEPHQTMKVLEEAGFRVIPTGIDHGTVTALMNDRKFEVTTLRHDVETHGRHATVAYTTSFEEDAARRDFTFNALSVDENGKLFDYFDGLSDLREGRVRFIGNASERIEEDRLRVLRFFRFYARYGEGDVDEDAFLACAKAKDKLGSLSIERVTREIKLLFSTLAPMDAVRVMDLTGVQNAILPGASSLEKLKAISEVTSDPIVRLVAYFERDLGWAKNLSNHLRLPLSEHNRVIGGCTPVVFGQTDDKELKSLIYTFGPAIIEDQCVLAILEDGNHSLLNSRVELVRTWEVPELPVKGRDILLAGVRAGPLVGKILKELEKSWIESEFKLSKEALLSQLPTHID